MGAGRSHRRGPGLADQAQQRLLAGAPAAGRLLSVGDGHPGREPPARLGRRDRRALPGPPAGHPVRIIEYDVRIASGDGGVRTEAVRLVTTLLDHEQAPARQLAELYPQRWEIEFGYGELKTRLRGPEVMLRSRSPQLIRQEIFAFLIVYQALCSLRVRAAQAADTDPDRISFTLTLRLARDQATSQAAATPAALTEAVPQTIADLLDELLPPRRSRSYERKKRPVKNTFSFPQAQRAPATQQAGLHAHHHRRPSLPWQTGKVTGIAAMGQSAALRPLPVWP